MDPVTLAIFVAALGTGLVKVIETLANEGLIKPALKPLSEVLEGKYDKKKAEVSLLTTVKSAFASATGSPDQNEWARHRWVTALEALKANPGLAARAAAAAVEMVSDDPARVPPDLAKDLNLSPDQRAPFAAFLFNLRQELVKVEGYGAGIEYADRLNARGQLAGLYQRVAEIAATVTDTPEGPTLRVKLVTDDIERKYLRWVSQRFEHLDLFRRDEHDPLAEPVSLTNIYIRRFPK